MSDVPLALDQPASLGDALRILQKWGAEARIVAGNTTLYELANQGGLAGVTRLIDIQNLGLNYVRMDAGGTLHIGSCTTYSELAASGLSPSDSYYAIKEVSEKITPPQVRNMGTIGGAACSGIPFYDAPVVLHALEAKMVIASSRGQRTVDSSEFFIDYFVTAIQPDELLLEIQIDSHNSAGSSFVKLGRTSVDFAVVNASAMLNISTSGERITGARISLGGIANTPVRFASAEAYLQGKEASVSSIVNASLKSIELEPTPSVHASSEYKRKVIPIVVREALLMALERARRKKP